MGIHSQSPPQLAELPDLISLARSELGPATAAWLEEPENSERLLGLLEDDCSPEDAVFRTAFEGAAGDSTLRGEFLDHFSRILFRSRSGGLTGQLGALYEDQDLVQSVLGDLLPRLADLEYRTKAQFTSYLVQKLTWKQKDKLRRHSCLRRDERRVRSLDPAAEHGEALTGSDLGTDDGAPSPLSNMVRSESEHAIVCALNDCDADASWLLRRVLAGEPLGRALADELGCSTDALRKRLERARRQFETHLRSHRGQG